MKNNYYHLSRDYERLFELLRAGHKIVGFGKHPSEDMYLVLSIEKMDSQQLINCEYYSSFSDNYTEFIEDCKELDLEWISNEK